MNRNYDGWILVSEGPTGVFVFAGDENCDVADLPTTGVGTGSVALRQDKKRFLYHETGGWVEFPVSGGSASGSVTITITENGTTVENVAAYAEADITVNVPNTYEQSDEGKVVSNGALVSQSSTTKNANGTYDTTINDEVVVDVPNTYEQSDEGKVVSNGALVSQSSTTKNANGTYDTTTNDEVVVAVPLPSGTKQIDADGTHDVEDYVYAEVKNKFLRGLIANSTNVQIENEYVIPSDLTEIGLGESHQYYVDNGAFSHLKVKKVSGPTVELLRGKLFANSKTLEEADFPVCRRFDNRAFQDAKSLKTVNFPELRTMDYGWGFSGNSALTTLELPKLTTVGSEGFCTWNSALTTLKIPNLPKLKQPGYGGQRAINNCTALTLLVVASLTEIVGTDMITNCTSLVNLSLPACLSIATPFTGDTSLANLFLPGSSLCALTASSPLADTPIASGNGTIWVNDDLVNQYKAATGWVAFASVIRPISEYTGQFDYNEGVT